MTTDDIGNDAMVAFLLFVSGICLVAIGVVGASLATVGAALLTVSAFIAYDTYRKTRTDSPKGAGT